MAALITARELPIAKRGPYKKRAAQEKGRLTVSEGKPMALSCFRVVALATTLAVAGNFMLVSANAGSFKIIYKFQGGADGANPFPPLININGTLYGATVNGGSGCECGTIFSITPAGVETVLYRFQGLSDGYAPYGLFRADNSIIGVSTSAQGGLHIFSVTPDGKFSVLGTAENPLWTQYRRPITEVAGTWYGVDLGTKYRNCGNDACGYIYAIRP